MHPTEASIGGHKANLHFIRLRCVARIVNLITKHSVRGSFGRRYDEILTLERRA